MVEINLNDLSYIIHSRLNDLENKGIISNTDNSTIYCSIISKISEIYDKNE